jgi:hypothetical protein
LKLTSLISWFQIQLCRYAVVTISAAAILGMFAERNLRYPEDRERLAAALKSRDAFEAFIVSGAGMLDFDGARRGQLGGAVQV